MSHKLETEKLVKSFYLDIVKEAETSNKITAAKKFKVSVGAIDSAYYLAGMPDKCSKSYLERKRGSKKTKAQEIIPRSITWEQIIKAIPYKAALAFLLIDGFTGRIKSLSQENQELKNSISEWEQKYNLLLEDRKNVMTQYNEHLAKEKCGGHFTLDETQHILIPILIPKKK